MKPLAMHQNTMKLNEKGQTKKKMKSDKVI